MWKKTIALVTLAALGTTASIASAQSNVTVYGAVDMGITRENNGGAAGAVLRADSGIMNGSRLGFKGSENLGGNMSAIFTVESGFTADTGELGQGGLMFGRQAWVGLSGDFGTVKLGRQKTVVYDNVSVFDPFVNGLAGDTSRLFNYSGSRTNNVVAYSYGMNGFRGDVQYGFGEVAGNNAASRTLAFDVGYRSGPVDAVLAVHRSTDGSGNITGQTTLIGGNYNFGVVKAYASYAMNKDVTPGGVIFSGADTRNALVGLTAPVSDKGTVIASYIRLTNKVVNNANANQIAIGYTYDLSKRTTLYTSYGRLAQDKAASYKVPSPGLTDTLLDVGIRHWF